jgi:hypothetical protein
VKVIQHRMSLIIEFHDNFFDCPYGDQSSSACTAYTGNFVMDQMGIPREYVTTGCLALAGFVVFYIFTSWLFLQSLPHNATISKEIKSSSQENATAESAACDNTDDQSFVGVTIQLLDVKLWLNKYVPFKRTSVDLVQDITVKFEPGNLNVIMGPSGTVLSVFEIDVKVLERLVY